MRTTAIDRLLRMARSPGIVSFAGGLPAPETFPRDAMVEASARALSQLSQSTLQYEWPEGRRELREQIARRLRARGAKVDAEDVLITSGAQDALRLALDAVRPGEIEVDAATYAGAIDLFEALRIRATARERSPVCYVMPAVHNPWGWSSTPLQRAAALSAEWVIEDDAYAELRFDGGPPTPLLAEAPERVFHVGTVSKTLSPGLRIGWLIAPRPWQRRVRELKAAHDIQASGLSQAIVEHLMMSGTYDERLVRLRAFYSQRCDAVLALLPRIPRVRFSVPVGGFSIWVETEVKESDEALLRRALSHGVAYDPGILFRPEVGSNERRGLRLSFSSTPMSEISLGIDRLGQTIDEARSARAPLVA
jgi:2-aminoadipate transaminase